MTLKIIFKNGDIKQMRVDGFIINDGILVCWDQDNKKNSFNMSEIKQVSAIT